MTEQRHLHLIPFAQAVFSRSIGMINQAAEGLTDEDLFHQPTPESNSIGWLAWHLSRRKDYYTGKLTAESEVWTSNSWAEKFTMDHVTTGLGHSAEEVSQFCPSRALLMGYVQAAHEESLARLSRITEVMLMSDVTLDANRGIRPATDVFNPMISDCLQHTGQIAYIRGMLTGRGWFSI